MKTLKIEIDDKYAGCIVVTCINDSSETIHITTGAYDLSKTNKLVIDEDGEIQEKWEEK